MMYQDKLVTAVRVAGKVLREQNDTVFMPFGSEYTLRFKNLNSLRALVRVSVDGQDATENTSLIVPANGTIDLERFIKEGNLDAGNRFKFIERTSKIEDHRGIGEEDGLIRVEFEFERQPTPVNPWSVSSTFIPYRGLIGTSVAPRRLGQYGGEQWSSTYAVNNSTSSSYTLGSSEATYDSHDAAAVPLGSVAAQNAVNNVGITVPGSISDQKFHVGSWFATDGVKHVMVLKLKGAVGEKAVSKPVTVAHKPTCTSCGRVNKATSKFCTECGTALDLVGAFSKV